MRLYLSSFDVGDCPEELVALTGPGRRAAIILNALDHRPQARSDWLERQAGKLAGLGFGVVELDLRHYFGVTDRLRRVLAELDLVWINGDLRAVAGAGRYIKRPPFNANFKAAAKRAQVLAPTAVAR